MCAEPVAACRVLMETLAEWHMWIVPRRELRHLHPAHLHTPFSVVECFRQCFRLLQGMPCEYPCELPGATWHCGYTMVQWSISSFVSEYGCCQRRDIEMLKYLVLPIFTDSLWQFWTPAHLTRVDFCLQQVWTHLNVPQKEADTCFIHFTAPLENVISHTLLPRQAESTPSWGQLWPGRFQTHRSRKHWKLQWKLCEVSKLVGIRHEPPRYLLLPSLLLFCPNPSLAFQSVKHPKMSHSTWNLIPRDLGFFCF